MSENDTLPPHAFVPLSPEELDAVIGDQIAIRALLGRGGMGAVYKGQQTRLGRTVAVKVLPRLANTGVWDFAERFMLEAKAMARLDHPNIVRIHDFGETETGLPYFVMEYVDGIDLASLIRGGQLTLEHIASWVPQTCEALEYAHNHELIHRDIKPANVMVSLDGMVKITDFGLVKMKDSPGMHGLTQTQISVGTPVYSAPEAVESGGCVDHRADVYSMGVILYELLTGQIPRGAWTPPSRLVPQAGERFDAIVVRAMQPDPADRYPRIADLGREVLAAARDTLQPAARRRLVTSGGGAPRRMKFPERGNRPLPVQNGLER